MNILELQRKISSDYFDYQALSNALAESGHIRRDIGKLIKAHHIIRVKKGLYIWGESLRQRPYSKQVLSNLIYGPSYISLEYALSFHGLTPERVHIVTAITPQRNKLFKTPLGTFEYRYLNLEAYPWGITWKKDKDIGNFFIASPEKALLDYLATRVKKWEVKSTIEDFLFKDLRLDEEEFKKVSLSKIKELSSYYKSNAIKNFTKEIMKIQR